ncbi:hypothetical protein MCOR02_002069 [Pyricularia oryzae]|nr:hypothetical protein MCOR02_002069 [Pyricularia oryzae]KAI6464000.1 hypothetical protein MCOR17_005486 [Pyricularia oryzae]KAI6627541.1 hypothetical protein MCOR14_008670 [Pyricularia oryzae]
MRHQYLSPVVMDFISGNPQSSDGDDCENDQHRHRPHGLSIAQPSDLIMDSDLILQDVRSLQKRVSRLEDKLLEDNAQTSAAAAIGEIKTQISQILTSQKTLQSTNERILKKLDDLIQADDVTLAVTNHISPKHDDQANAPKVAGERTEGQRKDNILSAWKSQSKIDRLAHKLNPSMPPGTLGLSDRYPSPYEETPEGVVLSQHRIDASKAKSKYAHNNLSGLNTESNIREYRKAIGPFSTAAERLTSLRENYLKIPNHSHDLTIRKKTDLTVLSPTEDASVREPACSLLITACQVEIPRSTFLEFLVIWPASALLVLTAKIQWTRDP